MVAMREVRIFRADEFLARNLAERVEDMPVGDPAAFQLPLDHCLALGGIVCHGCGHRAHLGWGNPQAHGSVPPMTVSDTVFAGSIPAIYDRYMVPLIFRPYAKVVAQRAKALG